MSLIRFSRSVPAPWMVRANSTCLRRQVAVGVFGQLLAEDQDEFSGVRSSCDMLARNSDLYFEVSASSVAFSSSARRACSISWFFAPPRRSLGQLLRLLLELLVGLLQLALLRLQLGGQLLGLLQQALGLHRRLDAVEHDADAGGELLEERHVRSVKLAERRQLDHRLHLALEQHRQHDDVARQRLEQAGADRHHVRGHVGDQHAALVDGALADEALADPQLRRVAAPCRRRRSRQQPQLRLPPASIW